MEGALAFAQSGNSTGGELTHMALNTLATEVTRLRAELAEEKRKVEVAHRTLNEFKAMYPNSPHILIMCDATLTTPSEKLGTK